MDERRVLLTGATGYVGGRLLPLLEERGVRLRCLSRRPEHLARRVSSRTEVAQGDLQDRESLDAALRGIDTAYYLVHSMGAGRKFEELDQQAVANFAEAARTAGVRRVVYLGGLGDESADLSPHLRSRHEVGRVLKSSGAQVIEFRASIIIGSGSLSFELIRALVEKLPIMICPRWVLTPAQPIAIEDVLAYLIAALELPDGASRVLEIGGPDQVSYRDIMHEYARQRGLRRLMIPVPVLSPAATRAGTTASGCGESGALWICWWAASGSAAAGAIRTTLLWATSSTAGASKRTSPTAACGWRPR